MITYFVPLSSEISPDVFYMVCKSGRCDNPGQDYRKNATHWRNIGLINKDGNIICFFGGRESLIELQRHIPLRPGNIVVVDHHLAKAAMPIAA